MPTEQLDKRPLLKQPTFYFVCATLALFIYAQWPKSKIDTYISQIAVSEYSIDFMKKPKLKNIKEHGIWLYSSSTAGVKFAVRYQESSSALSKSELQSIAIESFNNVATLYEFVITEPTQYEKGYFWSVSNDGGQVRESLWVLDKKGWLEIIAVYDNSKENHETLAANFYDSFIKTQ